MALDAMMSCSIFFEEHQMEMQSSAGRAMGLEVNEKEELESQEMTAA